MIGVMAWKEYREHRSVWATVAGGTALLLVTVALVLPALGATATPEQDMTGVVLASFGAVVTYGLVCGAMMLSGEREGGTLAFLDALSGQRMTIWWSKLLTGLVLTLMQGLVVAGIADLVAPHTNLEMAIPRYWVVVLPILALDAFAWGLLASAICESVLAAAGLGVAMMGLAWVLTMPCGISGGAPFFAVRGLFGLFAPICSALIFLGSDLQKTTAKVGPVARVRRVRLPSSGEFRALLWLCLRQGWGLLLGMAVTGLLVAVVVPAAGPLLWLCFTAITSVLCGIMVFASEQRDGSQQFLGFQRFPLGRLWMAKIAFWFSAALGVAVGTLILGALVAALGHALSRRNGNAGSLSLFHDSILVDGWRSVFFLPLGLLYGFSMGQFYALIWRKGVVALVVALAACGAMVGLWLPSILMGGLHFWQLAVPPIILLVATRIVVWDWASTGLWARRPAVILTAGGLLGTAWVTGSLYYRALEVPDVGDLVDRGPFEKSLPETEQNVAQRRFLPMSRELEGNIQRAKVLAMPAGQLGPGSEPIEQLKRAVQNGWPENKGPLDRFLDEAFNKADAEKWRAAIAEPYGMVEDPRAQDDSRRCMNGCVLVGHLLESRALQLQANREYGAALDHLLMLLRLSRHLRSHAYLMVYEQGQKLEQAAVLGLNRWLSSHEPEPERLRRLLAELRQHETDTTPLTQAVQLEYVRVWNILIRLGLSREVNRKASRGESTEADLLTASWIAPWESARVYRLVNAYFAAGYRVAESETWTPPAEPARDRDGHDARMLGFTELTDHRLTPEQWSRLYQNSWLHSISKEFVTALRWSNFWNRAAVRALVLQTALILYESEHGEPARNLDQLVEAKYLIRLPRDPFSGLPFGYRVSKGEKIPQAGGDPLEVARGQGVIWSVGPDGVDDGGRKQGREAYESGRRDLTGFDLIFLVPRPASKQ
jgi:hypothetical protein